MTFADYKPQGDENQRLLEQVMGYCDNLPENLKRGRGLTLAGQPGRGKTMLANLVLNAAYEQGYSNDAIDMSTFVSLFQQKFELNSVIHGMGSDMAPEIYTHWMGLNDRLLDLRKVIQFALFDDVGREYNSGTGWSNTQFDWYVRYRYNHALPTIITTNVPIPAWAERYSPSMESFLHESTTVLRFGGADYRKVPNGAGGH